jgi:Type I restriction enzyme R protein N terminus (HSDR_N)
MRASLPGSAPRKSLLFVMLNTAAIRHGYCAMSWRLGHDTHTFDSAAQWEKSGRADILIFCSGRPLAVVEVKREDLSLTDADFEQAQSYANQVTPRPPLKAPRSLSTSTIQDGGICPK